MRILFLSQWFNPEPIFKGMTYVRELARRGHSVHVLTGFPNYPGGEIYPGHHQTITSEEIVDGIRITRVPLYPSHDNSGLRRALNYSSFALSSALLGIGKVGHIDAVHVYQPITIGFAAMILKWLRGTPYIIDVQDLWPDFLPATGMIRGGPLLDVIGKWCDLVYRHAGAITTLSPGFRDSIVGRGVAPEKVEVVFNWCDEDQVDLEADRDPILAKELGLAGRFNVVFAGSMGRAQGLESVLDAASIVARYEPSIQFVMMGGGVDVESLKEQARTLGLENVLFLPRRPLSELGPILRLADIQLVHLRDDPLFATTIPSKTQTSLAVGRPILMGVRGDAADLVAAAGAGLPCRPQDPEDIAARILELHGKGPEVLDRMGASGKEFYRQNLSLQVGVDRFEAILRRVATGGAPC